MGKKVGVLVTVFGMAVLCAGAACADCPDCGENSGEGWSVEWCDYSGDCTPQPTTVPDSAGDPVGTPGWNPPTADPVPCYTVGDTPSASYNGVGGISRNFQYSSGTDGFNWQWTCTPDVSETDYYEYACYFHNPGVNFCLEGLYYNATKPVKKVGNYTLSMQLNDIPCRGDAVLPLTLTQQVLVLPKAPHLFASDQGSRLGPSADGGGSGCGSCGGGGDMPTVSITNAFIYTHPGGSLGPGGSMVDTGPNSPHTNYMQVTQGCDGQYYNYEDGCGKHYVDGPYNLPSSGTTPLFTGFSGFPFGGGGNLDDGSAISGSVDSSGASQCTVVRVDGATINYSIAAPPVPQPGTTSTTGWAWRSGPTSIVGPDGLTTTFSYNNSAGGSTYYDEVTTPNGDVWDYYHAQGDTKITSLAQRGALMPVTEISYVGSGNTEGDIQSVVVKDSSGNTQSETDYYYVDSTSQLDHVIRGSRTMTFSYDVNSAGGQVVTVRDVDASNNNATITETRYDYGDPTSETQTTTVIKHDPNNPNYGSGDDEVTVYTFLYSLDTTGAPVKTYISSVRNPDGTTTSYKYPHDMYYLGYPADMVYEIDFADSAGNPLHKIAYQHDNWADPYLVTEVDQEDSAGNPLSVEQTNYYLDMNDYYAQTIYVESTKDVRGNYTYYERDLYNEPWLVQSVKVAQGPDEPYDWSAIDPIKQYTYHGASDSAGMLDQLETETVTRN